VAAISLAVGAAADGPDEEDAGGNATEAKDITPGIWTGSIWRNATIEDTSDYFRLTFEGGRSVTAIMTLLPSSTAHQEVTFRISDTTMAEVTALSFPSKGAGVRFAALTNDDVDDPAYYFGITWDGSAIPEFTIDYRLNLTVGDQQRDGGGAGDVGSTLLDAHAIGAGDTSGSIGGTDGAWEPDINVDGMDVYAVLPDLDMFLGVQLRIDAMSDHRPTGVTLSLQNSTGGELDNFATDEVGKQVQLRYYPPTSETLYLVLTTTAEGLNYTISIRTYEPGAEEGKRADAGEDPDHAMDMEADTLSGTLMRGDGAADLADYYEVEFESGHFIEITLTLRTGTAAASKVVFHILDQGKNEVVNYTFSGLDVPRRFASLSNSEFPILRYYAAVTWSGDETDFEYRYELAFILGPTQNDKGTSKDVGNTSSGAPALDEGVAIAGMVGGSNPQWGHDLNVDGADVYELTPTANSFVVIQGTLDDFYGERRLGFDLRLEDQAGTLLELESVFEKGDEVELRHFATSTIPLYVVVLSESEMCNYTLSFGIEPPPEVDLFIGNVTITPSKPEPQQQVTLTVIVRSTTIALPTNIIRVEVFAGGDKLDHQDVIFDTSNEVVATFLWTVPSSTTDLTVQIDTLDAIPYETNEDNNARTIKVTIGEGDGDDGNGNEGWTMWFWIMILVGIIALAIVVAVGFVWVRSHGSEDEEAEDY
jgi:hypothetical protein